MRLRAVFTMTLGVMLSHYSLCMTEFADDKKHERANFLLHWPKLVNRHEFEELLIRDSALRQIKADTLHAAMQQFKLRQKACDMSVPNSMMIAKDLSVTMYFAARKMFFDVEVPFSYGSQKEFFISIMMEMNKQGEIERAFLVARAVIRTFSPRVMNSIFNQSLFYSAIRREENHLAPVPLFSDRARFTLYYKLFHGDLLSLIGKIRREITIDGDDHQNLIVKRRFIIFVLEIARQLLGGLTILHEKNLVHRDLKPANILYLGGLDSITIFISDFDDAVTRETAAKDPQFLGTEKYWSPQKHQDDLGIALTQADDCFALGMILWELLHAFDDVASPLEDLMREKIEYYTKNAKDDLIEYKGFTRHFAARAHFADDIIRTRNALYQHPPSDHDLASLIYGLTVTDVAKRLTAREAKSKLAKLNKAFLAHYLGKNGKMAQPLKKRKLLNANSTEPIEIELVPVYELDDASVEDEKVDEYHTESILAYASGGFCLQRHIVKKE